MEHFQEGLAVINIGIFTKQRVNTTKAITNVILLFSSNITRVMV